MANNTVVGNNGGRAKSNASFEDSGVTPTNTNQITKVLQSGFEVYRPSREINTLESWEEGDFFIVNSKIAMDLSAVLETKLNPSSGSAPSLPAPILTLVPVSGTQINASWTPISGAVSYRFQHLVSGVWNVVQNTSALTKSVTGLTEGTAYQFRVQAVADGTTNSDSPFDTKTATPGTVSGSGSYNDTFTGAAGAYSTHTPDSGTATVRLGAINLDGSGNAVFVAGGYAALKVNGTVPEDRSVAVSIQSVTDTKFIGISLRQNTGGTQYLLVTLTKTGTTSTLRILNEAGVKADQIIPDLIYPALVTAYIIDNVVYAKVNSLHAISWTDTSTGLLEIAEVQANDGAVLSSIVVQSNTTAPTTATLFFEDTFTGSAGAYSTHTPEHGTAAARIGAINLSGAGKANFVPGEFAGLRVAGTIPANRKINASVDAINPVTGALVAVLLRVNGDGTQYVEATLTYDDADTLTLRILDNVGVNATQVIEPSTLPLSLEVSLVGNLISAKVNDGTALTYSDTSTGLTEVAELQASNGATIDYFTVQAL